MSKVEVEGSHNQYPLTFNLGIPDGEENTLFLENEQFIYNLEQGALCCTAETNQHCKSTPIKKKKWE